MGEEEEHHHSEEAGAVTMGGRQMGDYGLLLCWTPVVAVVVVVVVVAVAVSSVSSLSSLSSVSSVCLGFAACISAIFLRQTGSEGRPFPC